MATGSEKEFVYENLHDAVCDAVNGVLGEWGISDVEDVVHLKGGKKPLRLFLNSLTGPIADDLMVTMGSYTNHLESLLAVAVGGLRKAWDTVCNATCYYMPEGATFDRDKTREMFCARYGITEQDFAALGIGDNH